MEHAQSGMRYLANLAIKKADFVKTLSRCSDLCALFDIDRAEIYCATRQ